MLQQRLHRMGRIRFKTFRELYDFAFSFVIGYVMTLIGIGTLIYVLGAIMKP